MTSMNDFASETVEIVRERFVGAEFVMHGAELRPQEIAEYLTASALLMHHNLEGHVNLGYTEADVANRELAADVIVDSKNRGYTDMLVAQHVLEAIQTQFTQDDGHPNEALGIFINYHAAKTQQKLKPQLDEMIGITS